MNWNENISSLSNELSKLSVRGASGDELGADNGFYEWVSRTFSVKQQEGRIYFIGNGASASMASHFSADLAKNGGIRTEVFFDLSLLTAVANDISYDKIFSEPLRWKMGDTDMLVAISSSGNSPNIVEGVKTAREIGACVITLSAMTMDNRIRELGHLNFYVPASTYGMAETAHAAVLHHWMDRIIEA